MLAALILATGSAATLSAQYAPSGYRYVAPQAATPVMYRAAPYWSTQPQYCPPGYAPPGYAPAPQRAPVQQPTPAQTAPDGQQPPQNPDPSQRTDPSQQTQPSQTQQDQQPQMQQQDFTPSPDTSSRASLSPGANTPQLGRADQINRLNLFDNMAAAPQSRAWIGYQTVNGFNTGLRLSDEFQQFIQPVLSSSRTVDSFTSGGITQRTDTTVQVIRDAPADVDAILIDEVGVDRSFFRYNQRLFRVGAEWAPVDWFSVSIQGQHYNAPDGGPPDDWTNPQIMLKYAFAMDCDTIVSATFGITPETETEVGEINEPDTKIYPGLLFYEAITPHLFLQGGFQFGVPMHRNEVDTADWSVSLGYWLYRDCCLQRYCGGPNLLRAFKITGIIPQVNLLGKHTMNNNIIVGPFGFPSSAPSMSTSVTEVTTEVVTFSSSGGSQSVTTVTTAPGIFTQDFPQGLIIYEEPSAVVDLTVGGQIIFANSIQVGLGYSLPISKGEVRDGEFLSSVTYLF
jgi:hypothetical protein